MTWRRPAMAAAAAAALASCTLCACAPAGKPAVPAADAVADAEFVTVAPYRDDHLSLVIAGLVDNRQPVGHALPLARIALASLTPEGEPVSTGDPIARLDPGLAQLLMKNTSYRIDEEEARNRLAELKTTSQLADLQARQQDLESQLGVYDAAIAASKVQDQSQLTIARLELANAEDLLAVADAKLRRLEPLVAAGHESRAALARVRDERASAALAVGLPRLRLELIEQTTNAVTRRRLQIARAQAAEELGGGDGNRGVVSDIRALAALQDKQQRIKSQRVQELTRDNAVRQDVIDSPVIAARASGLVRYRHAGVRIGGKLTASFFAYVLEDSQTVVTFALPDAWRGLVRPWSEAEPRRGLAELRLDAVPDRALHGRILSIAAVPEPLRDGARAFACAIALDDRSADLKVGMRVQCALEIPLDHPLAVIPTWCIDDLRHPQVVLADGSTRTIDGYAVDHEFVVTAGLETGERIAPGGARRRSGSVRLSGVIVPSSIAPIRLSSGEWELLEAVPDGSRVRKGDTVAKLSKSVDWRDAGQFTWAAEFSTIEARANLAIARINAEKDLARALVSWHTAAIQVQSARLDQLVARYGSYDEQEASTAAELGRARIRFAQAESEAADLDAPEAIAARSLNERMGLQLKREHARLALEKAELDHVHALRARDWLALRDSEESVRAADERASDARVGYSVARSAFQAALGSAQVRYRDELNNRRWQREQMLDEVVRAPRDGRVYQRTQSNGRLLKVGDSLETWEPFMMPIGNGRQFTVEVPARLFGRFTLGSTVAFVVPTLGPQPRAGKVAKVGAYFSEGATAREEQATRGTIGVSERVFQLTIGFELAEGDEERAAPGTTAYVDL